MNKFENPSEGMGLEKEGGPKVEKKVVEILESVPKNQLGGVISDLKWYLEYRRLDDEAKRYPGDSGRFDTATDKMMENFDLFDALNGQYGWSPENQTPKWTAEELGELIEQLETK